MEILTTVSETRALVARVKSQGNSVGFVPTMGALHEGHLTLIRRAKDACDFVVVSIFVNPTQFGVGEDFEKYPRNIESDAEKCESAGADLIFHPSASEIYVPGYQTVVDVPELASGWEGAIRPGHFKGVASVCARLFNIVLPDRAYFGQKDYQQLQVIQRMVADLHMPLEIVPVSTIRDTDGLALSSRNAYLTADQRKAALAIRDALTAGRTQYNSGVRSGGEIAAAMLLACLRRVGITVDYLAVADAETLEQIDQIDRPAVLLAAIRVGTTRLIDNELLT